MVMFFSKSYNEMRKDKIKAYQYVKIHQINLNESNSARWPINYYPNYHSFSEFGLQFLGIFLKAFISLGLVVWAFYNAFLHALAMIVYTICLDFQESYKYLRDTFYFSSQGVYLLASMILDPLLGALTFIVRTVSTIGLGLTKLIEENGNSKESELSPKNQDSPKEYPTLKEGETNGNESSYINTPGTKIERHSSSLTSNGFSDLMVNEDDWNNAPII